VSSVVHLVDISRKLSKIGPIVNVECYIEVGTADFVAAFRCSNVGDIVILYKNVFKY